MRKIKKYGLVVINDNKLLLCRPYAFPDLITIGGIIENDEDHITNLLREVREELGPEAKLIVSSLKYLGKFEDLAAGRTDTIVEIDLYEGQIVGDLEASSEIAELLWYSLGTKGVALSSIVEKKIIPFLINRDLLHDNSI